MTMADGWRNSSSPSPVSPNENKKSPSLSKTEIESARASAT